MSLYDSSLYMEDIKETAELPLAWDKLAGRSLAISGGTGLIGSFLVDVLMYRNAFHNQETEIYIIGRNEQKARDRFSRYSNDMMLHFVGQDITKEIDMNNWRGISKVDYVIHAASNTHPVAYARDPIGTISANVIGTDNLLSWAEKMDCDRFVFLSSVEIYGENKGDTDKFAEDYLGYLDCNTLRGGYPESKRTGEALCQAYISQKGIDAVIPRLSRVYGPTMLMSDTKALSQFILNGVNGQDIVLKSAGTQEFSYSYVADTVSAIFKIMFDGEKGMAYNAASENSDIMLKDLAGIIADYTGKKVVFDLPDATEQAGYSKATKATLEIDRLKSIGWKSAFDMKRGLIHTIDILREIK